MHLLKNLTKKNAKTTNQELNTLTDYHGNELQTYLLHRLFEITAAQGLTKDSSHGHGSSYSSLSGGGKGSNGGTSLAGDPVLVQNLLASRVPSLLQRPDFITLIAQTYPETGAEAAAAGGSSEEQAAKVSSKHLRRPIAHLDFLSKVLALSAFQKILFGIAFSYHPAFKNKAPTWVLARLGEFIESQTRNSRKPNASADEGEATLKTTDGYGIDGSLVPTYHTIVDFLLRTGFIK